MKLDGHVMIRGSLLHRITGMRKRTYIVVSKGDNKKYERHDIVDRRLIKKLNRKGLLIKIGPDNINNPIRSVIIVFCHKIVLYGFMYMMFFNKTELNAYERDMLKFKLSS